MRYCKTCHIHYDTDLENCMLCGGELEHQENDLSVYKFKEMSKKSKANFFYRLFIFLNFMSIFITLALDYLSGLPLSWSLVVSVTNLYTVVLIMILGNPNFWASKLTKVMISTVLVVILIALSLRDYSWAVDFVLPLATGSTIFVLSILIITNRKKWFDYFAPLLIITLVGLIPGLLFLLDLLNVIWPSIVCFSYASITLLGMIFLPSKSSREEFKRRFHI